MNNRFLDKEGTYPIKEVNIRSVDSAVVDYFNKTLKLHVNNPSGRKKVESLFSTGERWALIRKNNFRDENGTLILPIISIKRNSIDRTRGFGGMAQETKEITISRKIHPKSSFLQNNIETRRMTGFPEKKEDKTIYEYLTAPFPDFAIALYTITIWTQYQNHMNEILESIFYAYNWHDSFVMPLDYDGKTPKGNSFYFVGFRDGLDINNAGNLEEFTDGERLIKYEYNIKVPFYLLLNPKDQPLSYGRDEVGKNVVYKYQNRPLISIRESELSEEEYKKLLGNK